jgi:glycosyltransferase involved in cell wall biosynthesis
MKKKEPRNFIHLKNKFKSYLFLPDNQNRKGEGGLRTKKIIKKSSDSKPLVSIITVIFNGEKKIEKTIRSVLNQSYDNIEYIIIDGASTDKTLDIIKKYKKDIDYWVSESDNGIFFAMNKGIKLAKGDLVGLIHVGSIYNNDACKKAVKLYMDKKNLGIIAGSAKWKTLPNRCGIRSKIKPISPKNSSILHETLFIPLKIYKKIGLYNTNYRISADYDFIAKIIKKYNIPIHYSDDIFVQYLEDWNISGSSKNQFKKIIEHFKIKKQYVSFIFAIKSFFIKFIKINIVRLLRLIKLK